MENSKLSVYKFKPKRRKFAKWPRLGDMSTSDSSDSDIFNDLGKQFNSDSVQLDTGSVQLDTGSVQLDTDSVHLNTDSVDLDTDSVQIDTGSVQMDTGSVQVVQKYLQTIPHSEDALASAVYSEFSILHP